MFCPLNRQRGNRLWSSHDAQSRSLNFNMSLPRSLTPPWLALPKICRFDKLRLFPHHHSLPHRTSGPLFCLTDFKPQNVDWQMTSNRQAHHTDKFYNQDLIVRRGQAFKFLLTLNKPLGSRDNLEFVVFTGTYSLPPPPHTCLSSPWGWAFKGHWALAQLCHWFDVTLGKFLPISEPKSPSLQIEKDLAYMISPVTSRAIMWYFFG